MSVIRSTKRQRYASEPDTIIRSLLSKTDVVIRISLEAKS